MAVTELWRVDLDETEAALETLEAAVPRLSDDILERLDRMTDAALRRERRLAHIALRILLEARLGSGVRRVPFVRSASGKPSLAAADVDFSLAHTQGLALIAIGCGPLGVDVERTRAVRIPVARRGPIEAEAIRLAGGAPLAGPDGDVRFLSAWARIEAVAKAHGSGVGPILERLRPGRTRPTPPGPGHEMHSAAAFDIRMPEGVFAAVATGAGRTPPPLRVLPSTRAEIEALLASGADVDQAGPSRPEG